MKKILIGIKERALTFSYKKSVDKISNNLLNTNIITDNELIFSDEYINDNKKIVTSFIKELINQYDIQQVVIKESVLTFTVIDLINNNEKIKAIFFREEKQLSYEICDKVLTNRNIKVINCFSMPPYMIECFDKKGIRTDSRSEIMFTSPFMQTNNLFQYSKIFYKMSIRIELPLKDVDLDDFKIFCKINKYLRTIHLNKYSKNDVDKIMNILRDEKIKNVHLLIHDDITKETDINSIKKLNNTYKKQKLKLSLQYTDEYLKNNLFKQIVVNVLKVCGLITFFLVVSFLSYVLISNYRASKHVNKIKTNIVKTVEKTDQEKLIQEINQTIPEDEPKVSNGYVASLLTLNPETVGWLKVNDTNIDYPVVQTHNNKYYLEHNFNFENDHNGWVFMDYRNNSSQLSKNTIIYAHNRYYSGVMFGTLYKVSNAGWYNKKSNQTIKFDTLFGEMNWKVFSIYKTPVTSDYLQVDFADDEEWTNFISMIKSRSINDFGVDVGPDDKILTLSTCSSTNNTRLVLHAVLQK